MGMQKRQHLQKLADDGIRLHDRKGLLHGFGEVQKHLPNTPVLDNNLEHEVSIREDSLHCPSRQGEVRNRPEIIAAMPSRGNPIFASYKMGYRLFKEIRT